MIDMEKNGWPTQAVVTEGKKKAFYHIGSAFLIKQLIELLS